MTPHSPAPIPSQHVNTPEKTSGTEHATVHSNQVSPPGVTTNTMQLTTEWMDSIVGLEWEIYWGGDGDDSDWYEARVAGRRGTVFRVLFHGDETVYMMPLRPSLVRPSVRTWIRKSVHLLQQSDETVQDTRTLQDRDGIAQVEESVRREFPVMMADTCSGSNSVSTGENGNTLKHQMEVLQAQHVANCLLLEKVRVQLFLRTTLGPLNDETDDGDEETCDNSASGGEEEEDDDYDDQSDSDDDPYEPTEEYLDYLIHCLKKVEQACVWHYRCWELFIVLFGTQDSNAPPADRQTLVDNCNEGRLVLASLGNTTNVSKSAAASFDNEQKRKRQLNDEGKPVDKRRRCRLDASLQVPVSNQKGNCDDHLLQHTFLTSFVQKVSSADNRLVTQHCGIMLCSLSELVVSPYMKWERRVQFALGERDTQSNGDGETTTAPDESDFSSKGNDQRSPKETQYVSVDELQALVASAKTSSFLQRFPTIEYVRRLNLKIERTFEFEKKAWFLVGTVLDDSNELLKSTKDPIAQGLLLLWQEATTKDSLVGNVHPIGQKSSSMSRGVLENAMVYREWYLDLVHAETLRERVSFIDTLVSRLSKLPPLPTPPNSDDVSEQLTKVAARAQALWSICLQNLALFNRYQAILEERKSNNETSAKFISTNGVQMMLAELGRLGVVSMAEEMLAIRFDVLAWGSSIEQLFAGEVPEYEFISEAKARATEILEGKSATRQKLRAGLRHNSAAEAEIKAFAHADLDQIPPNEAHAKVKSLFASSHEWKKKANGLIQVIHDAISKKSRPVKLVDPKRLRDLLADVPKLGVNCKNERDTLSEILDKVVRWANEVSSLCSDASKPVDLLLRVLSEKKDSMSPALALSPSWDAIDNLTQVLSWYLDAKSLVGTHDISIEQLRIILLKGSELIRNFKTSNGMDGQQLCQSKEANNSEPLNTRVIESDQYASAIVKRILRNQNDDIFHQLIAFEWHLAVSDFVSNQMQLNRPTGALTLKDARILVAHSQPLGTSLEHRKRDIVSKFRLNEFHTLMSTAEDMENRVRSVISAGQHITSKGPDDRCDVESCEKTLTSLHNDLQEWQQSNQTLSLESDLANELKRTTGHIQWLVRPVMDKTLALFSNFFSI